MFDEGSLRERLNQWRVMKVDAANRVSKHLAIEPSALFLAYMRNSIPETGVCEDGTRFFFHGLGCSVSFPEAGAQVDLEFGPGGRVDSVSKETLCHFLGYSLDECDSLLQFLLDNALICAPSAEHDGTSSDNDQRELDASVQDRFSLVTT